MSQINVNTIKNKSGAGAPNFPAGAVVTGVVTATTFKGNFDGGGNTITGINADNIASGSISVARVPTLNQNTTGTAGNLSGTPNITVGSVTGTTGTFSGNVSVGGTLTYEDVKNIDSVGIVTAREGVFIPDTKELQLGNTAGTPDVKLYSTGTNGWVYTPQSGADLYMGTNAGEVYIQTGTGGNDTAIKVNSGGSVEINHSTNKKFETTNDGTVTTGIATATSVEDSKGDVRSIPRLDKSSAYTITAADAGKCITADGDITVPNAIMSEGDAVTIIADGTGNITITQAAGLTMYNAADASTGNRTLALRGMANIWFKHTSYCYISGAGLS
tara:strand:- start:2154 stop:3143 length:990 start_codon:yes stop_codon:yes gene_type:complete